jgi:hypothetical protein
MATPRDAHLTGALALWSKTSNLKETGALAGAGRAALQRAARECPVARVSCPCVPMPQGAVSVWVSCIGGWCSRGLARARRGRRRHRLRAPQGASRARRGRPRFPLCSLSRRRGALLPRASQPPPGTLTRLLRADLGAIGLQKNRDNRSGHHRCQQPEPPVPLPARARWPEQSSSRRQGRP